MHKAQIAWIAVMLLCGLVTVAHAQDLPTRSVDVDGRPMRVWTAGLESRRAGQPVIVLEPGAGAGLESWTPVFDRLATVAPVIAYDRRGTGGSAPGVEQPNAIQVARWLHRMLGVMQVAPPYVLVGHSWGGVYITAFSDQFPSEVAGLVYIDTTDFTSTREEKAALLPPAEREEALRPPVMPPLPADAPPGLRAELESIAASMISDYADTRRLKRVAGVPIAVIVATPPGRMQGTGGLMARLQIQKQSEWTFASPQGLFVAASHVGHYVHRADPALVVRVVSHVVAPPPPLAR
ncbi:MAG: alpha/beta fold hydrolase [Vicinamibacterales bacterium]